MGWKDFIFEKEPNKPTSQPLHRSEPVHVPASTPPPPPTNSLRELGTGSAIYQRLKDKTLFENTPVGQTLNKYLTPLLALPIDERAKYKAAMAQAQAQENVTVSGVIGAFDVLKEQLNSEQAAFDASIAESTSGIEDKRKQQEDLQKQIATLTAQCTRLEGEMAITKTRITRAQQDFRAAHAARTAELEEQKVRYTDLLK